MRDELVKSLTNLTGSTNATVYLNSLTNDQLSIIYPLLVEAPEDLLNEFSKLSSFQIVVDNVLKNIDDTSCCDFPKVNRQRFVKYALPFVTNNTVITYSNLLSLGNCFSSALPIEKLSTMNETDFMNYFPNLGKLFQPDENETVQVIAKINSLASQQTSQENFVFTVLNDLAMYYSNFSSLNTVS